MEKTPNSNDLELLLLETDREDPILPEIRDDSQDPVEEIDYFSRKCLVARRLLERGVRFVQIWSGNDNGFPRRNW